MRAFEPEPRYRTGPLASACGPSPRLTGSSKTSVAAQMSTAIPNRGRSRPPLSRPRRTTSPPGRSRLPPRLEWGRDPAVARRLRARCTRQCGRRLPSTRGGPLRSATGGRRSPRVADRHGGPCVVAVRSRRCRPRGPRAHAVVFSASCKRWIGLRPMTPMSAPPVASMRTRWPTRTCGIPTDAAEAQKPIVLDVGHDEPDLVDVPEHRKVETRITGNRARERVAQRVTVGPRVRAVAPRPASASRRASRRTRVPRRLSSCVRNASGSGGSGRDMRASGASRGGVDEGHEIGVSTRVRSGGHLVECPRRRRD